MMRTILIAVVWLAFSSTCAADVLPNAAHIYVEGRASIDVTPDTMTLTVRYEATAPTADAAKPQIDEKTRALISAFKRLDIRDSDVTSTATYVAPATEYRDGQSRIIGTLVSRTVTVTLRKLANYGEFIAAVMSTNPSSVGDVEMGTEKGKDLIARAQIEALADARARAERLAGASNMKLGTVYSVSEFALRQQESFELLPERYISDKRREMLAFKAERAGRDEPFVPGTIWATAKVFVVFLLEPKQ